MKNSSSNIFKLTAQLTLAVLVCAAPALVSAAYIPLAASLKESTYTYSYELDIQQMMRVGFKLQQQNTINTARYIPLSMPSYSSDGTQVAGKILKHTVQNWLDDDKTDFQLVRQAQKINDSLSADLPIGDSSAKNDSGKFKVRVRPVSTEAQLQYEGSFGANLSYNIAESTTKFQVSWNF